MIVDDILFQLKENPLLLRFLNRRISPGPNDPNRKNQEIELFTIIEMVGAASYSVILNNEPVSLEEYLPCLHRCIRALVESFH